MSRFETEIEKLAATAATVNDGADALRFSQAALNLAHAESVLNNALIEKQQNKKAFPDA